MIKYFGLLLTLLCFSNIGNAQTNFTLYNLNDMPQAQYLNPAFRSSSKVALSIAPFSNLINFNTVNTAFAVEDILQKRPNSDSLDLNIGNVIDQMNDIEYFDIDLSTEIFNLIVTTKKTSLNFSVRHQFNSSLSYSKNLFELLYYGNGSSQLLGNRASLDGLGYNLTSYVEFGAGINRKIGDKLTIGAKIKYIAGVANVQTETSQFGIHTNENTFDLTIDGSAKVNLSNPSGILTGVNPSSIVSPMNILNTIRGVTNNGFGLDLGFKFDITDKIKIAGSIIDLGKIKWRSSVANYTLKEFNFIYDGIDLNNYLDGNNDIFQEVIDSLETIAKIDDTYNTYSTSLYTKSYLSGSFELTKFFHLGAVWYNSFYTKRYETGLNLNAKVKLKHWLSVSGNYSMFNNGLRNFGAGISVRTGPMHFYALSDSMIGLIRPEYSRTVNLSFGIGFQFGKTGKNKKEKIID